MSWLAALPFAIIAAGAAFVAWCILTAPEDYETDEGFFYGKPPVDPLHHPRGDTSEPFPTVAHDRDGNCRPQAAPCKVLPGAGDLSFHEVEIDHA